MQRGRLLQAGDPDPEPPLAADGAGGLAADGRTGTANAHVQHGGEHHHRRGDTVSTVTESVDVDVPVRTAYNQWTQFEEFPRFMGGVPRSAARPTTTHWKTEIDGVKREFDAKITEQLPDERVAWTSTEGSKQAGVVTFHRLDETHTRVTVPDGLRAATASSRQAGDKLGFLDRQVKGDMKRFKEYIESRGGVETGAWRGEVDRPNP